MAELKRPLLQVRNLRTVFDIEAGTVKAVDGVSFQVEQGKTLGIVGESGCGKSVSAMSIMRLVPEPPGRIVGGEILWKGTNILAMPVEDLPELRGKEIAMIFQNPIAALNPVLTVGYQLAEAVRAHLDVPHSEATDRGAKLLARVGISEPRKRMRQFPHQFSGGMAQRVMIAMALACQPQLLIADEPTTALDVTIQAQILVLMDQLQEEFGSSILMITHDLGVIAETADEVAVMYAGMIAESSTATNIFEDPRHPYTRGLLRSIPRLERETLDQRIQSIPGVVPDPAHHPAGCRFHPRCPFATPECSQSTPDLEELSDGHMVRCFHPQQGAIWQ